MVLHYYLWAWLGQPHPRARCKGGFRATRKQLSYAPTTSQWGFLEGRSTVTALLKCTDDWLKTLEEGNDVCAVFFDYRKAFDSVPHRPLIEKLRALGLDDCIVNWIREYLTDRTQVVAVDGVESNPLPVLYGVPQGSAFTVLDIRQ